MSTSLSGSISSSSSFTQSSTSGNVTYSGSPSKSYTRTFSATDVTKVYFATLSITTSPTSVDVTSLTDVFGSALSFATVKHLQIVNNSTTANLSAGGGTNGLFSALPTLIGQAASSGNAGSCINLTTNLTVDGTHKIIALTSSSGTISVEIIIVGS